MITQQLSGISPPPPGAPPDILPLLCSWPLVVEISAGPLVLEKEEGAMIPIQVMHSLLPLADDDLPLLLQLVPGLGPICIRSSGLGAFVHAQLLHLLGDLLHPLQLQLGFAGHAAHLFMKYNKNKTGFTESEEGISRSCAGQPWAPSSCPEQV